MSAGIYDVEINIDGNLLCYAKKVSASKNKESNTVSTFDGDVNIGGNNTGGTISIERLQWPQTVEEAIQLENKLNSNNINVITCGYTSETANGELYRRIIKGTGGLVITTDDEDWEPSNGVTQKLEMKVNNLVKTSEKLM